MTTSLEIYFKKISKYPLLTKEEEQDLSIKAQNGDKLAEQKIITSNLRLVVTIAKKYKNVIDILDAINQGNIGLMQAVHGFDGNKNLRFGTYASWWINRSITNFIYFHNDLVKQPSSFFKLQKHLKNFYSKSQMYPTLEQLSELTKIDKKTIISSLTYYQQIDLDAPISEENKDSFHEIIPDIQDICLFDREFLLSHSYLNEKEKFIITSMFGFNEDGHCKTLKEVAEILNVSHECIRQTKNNALAKIRRAIIKHYNDIF